MLNHEIDQLLAQLAGNPEAKERLRLLIQVERGELAKADACAALAMTTAEFDALWEDALRGMLEAVSGTSNEAEDSGR